VGRERFRIDPEGCQNPSSARNPSFDSLHGFHSEERLHEALGDLPPAEWEIIKYRIDNTPMLSAR